MKDIKKIQEFFSKSLEEAKEKDSYEVVWTDRDYKRYSKVFKNDPKGAPENAKKKAETFKKALEDKDKKSTYGLYRSITLNEAQEEDPVDTITMDVPLFLRMLEYSREDAAEDMDLHDVTEKAISLGKERGILQMEDYNEIIGGAEEIDKTKLNEETSEQNLYSSISNTIPENTNYEDLAKAIAKILKEDYGSHNFKPFITTLVNELKI